jgi:excisionase family DNA binding protein
MELINYEDAAKLLGVSQGTLVQAVIRGELTKAGIRQGNRCLLMKEQVLLFAGINPRTGHKKRISRNALTNQEREMWNRYAKTAERITAQPQDTPVVVDEATVQHIVDERVNAIRQEIRVELAEALRQLGEKVLSPKTQAIAV